MQSTSETWKSMAAELGDGIIGLEAKAIINGVEYTEISAPLITRSLMPNGLSVGNVISAMCQFSVRTGASIPKSAEVQIKIRLTDGDNYSEWLDTGTFYISRRKKDPGMGVVTFDCYDSLLKANAVLSEVPWTDGSGNVMTTDSGEPLYFSVAYPLNMASLVHDIVFVLGMELDERTVINSEYVMTDPGAGASIRDVLGIIAAAHGGNWIVTPQNKLRLVPIVSSEYAAEATENVVDVNGVVSGIATGTSVETITGVKCTIDSEEYIAGDETGVVLSVALSAQQALELSEHVIGLKYQAFELQGAIYDPAVELGDYVRYGQNVSSVLYTESAELGALFMGNISAPDPEELADEYPYVGASKKSLTQAMAFAQQEVTALDDSLDQQGVFDRLTNDGDAEAISLNDGQLYTNADYMNVGTLDAGVVNVVNLDAGNISTGTLDADRIAAGTITSDKIAAGAVTADEIQAGAITTEKIDANAITADKIDAGAITAGKIATDAVTADKIAAGTITADEIHAGAIGGTQIANGAITADKIEAGAITTEKIATGAVTADEIAAGAITADMIKTGTMSAERIEGGVLELGGSNNTHGSLRILNANGDEVGSWNKDGISIDTGSIDAGTINAGTLDASQITVEHLSADSIDSGHMAADTIQGGTLTLGGTNNTDGVLEVKPSSGNNNLVKLDSDGIYAIAGTIGPFTIDADDGFSYDVTQGSDNYNASINHDGISFSHVNSNNFTSSLSMSVDSSGFYPPAIIYDYYGATVSMEMDLVGHGEPSFEIIVGNDSYIGINSAIDLIGQHATVISGTPSPSSGYSYTLTVQGTTYISGYTELGGNIYVRGTKSRIVSTDQYAEKALYCYETPSPMFGDIGEGVIGDDELCYITIDPVFAQTIATDSYQVFLQPYGEGQCFIKKRYSGYFIVQGTAGLSFGWEIKSKQKGFENRRLDNPEKPYTPESTDYGQNAAKYIEQLKKEREAA